MYRLAVERDGVWIQLLRNKYLYSKTLAQVTAQPSDSPFWKGLMRTKVAFFNRSKFIVGNGQGIRFWEITWLGETPLALQYPSLYNIVQWKEVFVGTVLGSVPLNIQFRRSLVGDRWDRWLHLLRRLTFLMQQTPYTGSCPCQEYSRLNLCIQI